MRDAFDVLGLEPRFAIDPTELDGIQRQLLADLHPNRNPHATQPDAGEALFARQGEINEAYRQLRDPLRRAELLLQRRNVPFTGLQSPELLSRIFDQREALEQAITQSDVTALSNCVGAALSQQAELVHTLEVYFSTGPAQTMAQSINIASIIEELRYLSKLVRRGDQALDDFE